MANGCFVVKAKSQGYVAKSGSGYRAAGATPAEGEPFYMKPTELGRYLFYSRARDYLGSAAGKAQTQPQPSEAADWAVEGTSGSFRITLGRAAIGLSGDELVLVDPARGESFAFERAQGCAGFPEVELNATGTPSGGPVPYGEVRGYADPHEHLMAFQFLGGGVHCGKPWHRYGVEYALRNCENPQDTAYGVATEKAYTGRNAGDRTGWPTFPDWPAWDAITQEYTYYRWLERGWMGGVRLVVNLLTDNEALCIVYPTKRYPSCDEMESVRRQAHALYAFENYIDAQAGGPGKGFFRIVADPFEARRVINAGKMAVVIGIETSAPFRCKLQRDVPLCDRAAINAQLDEMHRMGLRSMEILNKFDNALAGVAGDPDEAGLLVNSGNKLVTGKYWEMQTCAGQEDVDRHQHSPPGSGRDGYGGLLQLFLPPGEAPVYPPGPHCNVRGLSALGEHLVRRMMERGMLIDPDHMSVLARGQLLNLTEAEDYGGLLSSHSWSTPEAYRRILRAGGFVAPATGGLENDPKLELGTAGFVDSWRYLKARRSPRFLWGLGFGADMNGFAKQNPPRQDSAVKYPFKSFDGAVTFDRQRSGFRTFDLNKEGVSHYGMIPDWIEDVRNVGGQEIQDDMARGAEHYLQTWERAVGVPGPGCRSARGKFTESGLFNVHLGRSPQSVLERAGQPATRQGRVWTWCVEGTRNAGKSVAVAYSPQGRSVLVGSNALGHRSGRVERGGRVTRKLRARTKRFGSNVLISRRGRRVRRVYVVRRKRVAALAVASKAAFESRRALAEYLALAGLR